MVLMWRRLAVVAMAVGGGVVLALGAVPLAVGATEEPAPVSDSSAGLTSDERSRLVESLIASTFRVTARGCGAAVVGSGFAVEQMVVTNSHVVGDASTLEVDQPSGPLRGRVAELALVVGHPEIDFAAATASAGISAVGLSWSHDLPAAGQPVMLAGYGGGRDLAVVGATVHAVVDGGAYGNQGPVILLDQAIVAGFSGGPVLDRDGRVVGVLRAYDSLTGLTIATPSAMIVDATGSSDMHADLGQCN